MPKAPPDLAQLIIQWIKETYKLVDGWKPVDYSGLKDPYSMPLGRVCMVQKGMSKDKLGLAHQVLVFRDEMVCIEGANDVALFDVRDSKFFKKLLPYVTFRLSKFGILPK